MLSLPILDDCSLVLMLPLHLLNLNACRLFIDVAIPVTGFIFTLFLS